jgi:hypothetical protein
MEMRSNGISIHPKISLSHKDHLSDISPFPDSSFFFFFNDTELIWNNDRHYTEMAGNQPSCHFTQENLASSVSKHMGLQALQDCKVRRCQ